MSNEVIPSTQPVTRQVTSVGAPPLADAKNIVPAGFPSLFSDNHPEPLRALYTSVLATAGSMEAWYRNRKEGKKRGAYAMRVMAVLLTAAATLAPIIREVWPTTDPNGWKPVPFSALFAALAATCIALDKLLGFSSGWVRYINAMMELQAKIDAFKFAWSHAALEEQIEPKTPRESLSHALGLLSGLLNDMREVLRAESQAWAAEFRSTLVELEKSAEVQKAAAAALPSTGAIRVRVKNADQLDGRCFRVRLNDGPSHEGSGSILALNGLQPGQVRVRVSAMKGQVAVFAEEIAQLRPGEIASVEVELV